MYAQGVGVPRDRTNAAEWFRNSAEQGHPQSQHNLAVAYSTGIGVARDDAQAARWYRKAAEQGDAHGQFNLGNAFYEGQGVRRNHRRAIQWFDKAAKQTNVAPAALATARRVLVDGMTAREAAEFDGVEEFAVFNALANVCSRHDEKI